MSLGVCKLGFTGAVRRKDRNLDQVWRGVMGGEGGCAKWVVKVAVPNAVCGAQTPSPGKRVTFNGQSLPLGADKSADHRLFLITLLQ